MTTSYRTTIPDPYTVIAIQFLSALVEAPVTVSDQITRADCGVCNEFGRFTAATVYGDPVPEASQPAVVDCCPRCLPSVADRARRELRDGSRVGVRIEVAPWIG
ncbi:hypothetical protein [Saccharothrix stipae]